MKTFHIHHTKHHQRGAVLLLSLVIAVFLSVLLGAAIMRSNVQVKEMVQKRQFQEAFYAAEAAINKAIYHLRQSSNWKPGTGGVSSITDDPFQIDIAGVLQTKGFYSLTVTDAPKYQGWDSRWIDATGKDANKVISRKIRVRVIVESPSRFLISTLGPLHITSGSTINATTLSKDLYFDVNDSLGIPANEIHMNDDAYYIKSKTGDNNPAVLFAGGKSLQKSPSITFAGVDLNRYKNLAQDLQASNSGYYKDGDLTVNLANLDAFNPSPGTSFQPQIIYANGDIHIDGEYSNSILIVAAGNIYINGNIMADTQPQTPPQLGLFAKGDVIIPTSTTPGGDLSIEGFILADGGNAGSQGAFIAEGAKYSKGNLNFKGSISVRGNGTQSVDLNVFNNRNYEFNPELSNNRTIPFTPFIVTTVQWQEET